MLAVKLSRQTRGLTLVELLVVVAIIGILVAMCPCSCGIARERARRANCLSNLKQLGLGIAQYSEDYTNMPPMGTMRELAGDIAPYIGHSEKLFRCPSDTNPFTATAITNLTRTSYIAFSGAVWQASLMAPLMADKFAFASPNAVLAGKVSWSTNSSHTDGGNVLWNDGHGDWNRSLDVGTNRYPVVND